MSAKKCDEITSASKFVTQVRGSVANAKCNVRVTVANAKKLPICGSYAVFTEFLM